MPSQLFTPIDLGGVRLPNRIVIAPMCQYSADDGSATDWHSVHLGGLALSGAGLLIVEATAVTPEGRITAADLGLWSEANEAALARVVTTIRRWSPIRLGIQLAHAGRKASTQVPWAGGKQIAPGDPGGWQTEAPSPLPFTPGDVPPTELDAGALDRLCAAFAAAAARAARLGFDLIELHGAHGYLLHEFLSPLSNRRTDDYGGTLENRLRFPLRVFDAVRAAVPADRPVGYRVSATDWIDGGWDLDGTIAFARALAARGCSFIDVSSGGLAPEQKIAAGPGYQVPFARAVRAALAGAMPVIAVGLITEPDHAEAIVATGDADAVALARGMLFDPRWPWHAAARLGATVHAPDQYKRSQPTRFRHLFDG